MPRLTDAQREALAAISEAAEALHISYDLQPGDIQLLHNWTQLHTRTAFVDEEVGQGRAGGQACQGGLVKRRGGQGDGQARPASADCRFLAAPTAQGWDNRRHLLRLWAMHPEGANPISPDCECRNGRGHAGSGAPPSCDAVLMQPSRATACQPLATDSPHRAARMHADAE